jgi:hypothetical protein
MSKTTKIDGAADAPRLCPSAVEQPAPMAPRTDAGSAASDGDGGVWEHLAKPVVCFICGKTTCEFPRFLRRMASASRVAIEKLPGGGHKTP